MTNAVTWRESALRGTLVWFCPWSNAPSRSATIPRQSSTPLKTQADPCKLPRFLNFIGGAEAVDADASTEARTTRANVSLTTVR